MSEIIESRNIKVRGRVVSLENIRRLSSIILVHYKHNVSKDVHCRIRFSASCFDNSHFESSDIEVFSNNSVLVSKRVSDVSINYSSYETNEEIKVSLSHGDSEYENYIRVSGTDSAWVNGIVRKLEEEISAFNPQNEFLTRYKRILEIMFALSIGSVYFYVLDLIPSEPIEVEPPKWLIQLAIAVKDSMFLLYLLKYSFMYLVVRAESYVINGACI